MPLRSGKGEAGLFLTLLSCGGDWIVGGPALCPDCPRMNRRPAEVPLGSPDGALSRRALVPQSLGLHVLLPVLTWSLSAC